jgi:hypothetical protein
VADNKDEVASQGGEEEAEVALCVREEIPEYQELDCARRVQGVANFSGNVVATINAAEGGPVDDYDGKNGDADSLLDGPMKEYIAKIQKQLRKESSSELPAFSKKWLHEFFDEEDYWIPKARAKWMCHKLNIQYEECLYYRNVFVWLPKLQGGQACMPSCVSCKNNANVSVHGYTLNHPACYVVGVSTHYYIMTWRYICHVCKHENKRRKEACEQDEKIDFVPLQYTFMVWNQNSMKLLPFNQAYKFPAFLLHKAGLDLKVADMLPSLFDSGLGPEAASNLLLENHTWQHTNDHIVYEL